MATETGVPINTDVDEPWMATVRKYLPEAVGRSEDVYIEKTFNALQRPVDYGFRPNNTLTLVCVCRDELNSSFQPAVDRQWYTKEDGGSAGTQASNGTETPVDQLSFTSGSLAGMFFMGKSGLGAALAHAQDADGKQRLVFYAMAHIGVSEKGVIGSVHRANQDPAKDNACGALLHVFKGDQPVDDVSDIEYYHLVRRLEAYYKKNNKPMPRLAPGHDHHHLSEPDQAAFIDLTKAAVEVIHEDIKVAIAQNASDPKLKIDYAVFIGILINTPTGNLVWPKYEYVVVKPQARL